MGGIPPTLETGLKAVRQSVRSDGFPVLSMRPLCRMSADTVTGKRLESRMFRLFALRATSPHMPPVSSLSPRGSEIRATVP